MKVSKTGLLMTILFTFSIGAYSQLWKQYSDSAKSFNDKKEVNKAVEYYSKAKEELQNDSAGTNSYAQVSTSLGNIYKATRKFDKAEPLLLEALQIRENLFGKLNADYALSCNYLGSLYENMKNYDKAEPLFLEALQIREQVLGQKNAGYATSCNNLGILYENMHKYDKAEPFYIKAKQIREEVLGKDHLDYASSCHNLATLYNRMFQLEKAEPLYLEAKRVRGKNSRESPDYFATINNLAVLYEKMAKAEKAEPLYLEKKQIVEETVGKTDLEYGLVCENLGIFYHNKLEYKKAEIYFIEAKSIIEQAIGQKQPEYAIVCYHFADLYSDQDLYEKAEPLYLEAKQIMEWTIGKRQPEYTTICQNLAITYTKMGLFEKAEALYIEAIKIREDIFTKNHTLYASACENLAILYQRTGEYEKAEALYKEAGQITRGQLGDDHPSYAGVIDNLGSLYIEMKRYDLAGPLLLEAKKIREVNPGKHSPVYASSCTNLAALYSSAGLYNKAEPLFIESKQIRETIQGKEHPDYAEICVTIANLYRNSNRNEKANNYYKEAFRSQNKRINNFFQFASEAEQQSYLEQIEDLEKSFLSFATVSNFHSNQGFTYDVSLSRRNLVLSSSQKLRKIVNNSNDTALKNKYNEWIEKRKELSAWYTRSIADRQVHVKTLEDQTNTLEKELAQRSIQFKYENRKEVSDWKSIQQALKYNEAAIEFIEFKYTDGRRWTDSTYYVALLLRKDRAEPVLTKLFEKKQLDTLLNIKGNQTVGEKINTVYSGNQSIYNIIWKPLEKHLNGISKIYFASAGNLFKISFAAIPVNNKQVLGDRYQLIQLNTTASIADNKQSFLAASDKLQLYGGVQYDADSNTLKESVKQYIVKNENSQRSLPPDLSGKGSWKYLPGTEREVSGIEKAGSQKNSTVHLSAGIEATEESVKALNGDASPAVLHIATHGFFFPDPKIDKRDSLERMSDNIGKVFKQSDNPLFRSGLIFAGANNAWLGKPINGIEDGILTSYEVSNLYLPNTKLVVLSACETALGDIQGSEGVFGLQRAFKMAGVQNLVMSLWKIGDKETAEFMQSFYKNLFDKQSVNDAFYNTQRIMKNKYRTEPYKWAAWILLR